MLLWWLWSAMLLLTPLEAAEEDDDVRAGCSTAVNDLVYIVDGSWSVGFPDFETAKQWLINITSLFDISSHYTQVAVIQYSDTPRLEIPLGGHQGGAELIQAIQSIAYLGGNTQTGRAIKFAVDHVFSSSQRANQVKNRIAVVVTDGKSQDDVVDASVEARAQGITLFAVGVGSEITTSELVSIANKPSSTYVLYAEDYTTIDRIRDSMEQKLCEESVCPTRIPVASRDEKGFELMVGMNIEMKAKKIPGSLVTETAFALSASTDITENTRAIFPEGLPPSYVFVATLRLQGPSAKLTFDLWRVLSKDKVIQAAVTLSGKDKTVTFTTTSVEEEEQRVVFKAGFQDLYDGKWHQLKLLVRPRQVASFLDDLLIQEVLLEPAEPVYINGETQVAKRRGTDSTVPVEIQKLRLYCDPHQSDRETACEIYSVDDERCTLNRTATVEEDDCSHCALGPPGQRGPPGRMGFRGEKGREGPPGPDGKPGKEGNPGKPGPLGLPGMKGEDGPAGLKGEPGLQGSKGDRGEPGSRGESGAPGPKGLPGDRGEAGPPGEAGSVGEPGLPGTGGLVGPPGTKPSTLMSNIGVFDEAGFAATIVGNHVPIHFIMGQMGAPGLAGAAGAQGAPGVQGPPGEVGLQGPLGETGLPGPQGLPGITGIQGPRGPPGQIGQDGPKGTCGDPGVAGSFGPPGLKGSTGEPGVPGLPGGMGMPGFKGHKGEGGETGSKGQQGERGRDGDPGNPGVAGEVGPRGGKGEKGVTGDMGPRGREGKKGDMGHTGHMGTVGPRGFPGQDGLPGQPGQPGYPGKPGKPPSDEHLLKLCTDVLRNQLPALLRTLAPPARCEPCESEKGPRGEPGAPGPKGSMGTPGYPGRSGSPGYPGPPGLHGPGGLKGDMGPKGLKGSKGEGYRGPPGSPGQPGIQGPRGFDGIGHPGNQGIPGKPGSPGDSGKRGSPGLPGVCDVSMCYQTYNLREHYSKGPNV